MKRAAKAFNTLVATTQPCRGVDKIKALETGYSAFLEETGLRNYGWAVEEAVRALAKTLPKDLSDVEIWPAPMPSECAKAVATVKDRVSKLHKSFAALRPADDVDRYLECVQFDNAAKYVDAVLGQVFTAPQKPGL